MVALVLEVDPVRGHPHMIARRAVDAPSDAYAFRSGEPVDMAKVGRARWCPSGAAYALSIALAQGGKSDAERDFNLDEAWAALEEARRLLIEARTPEPPRVAPAAVPSIFSVACDIVGARTEAA